MRKLSIVTLLSLALSVQSSSNFKDTLNSFLHKDQVQGKDKKFQEKGPDHLYVHLIPHTHDDVGWLKTVDEYFAGSRYDIQIGNVELILDTTIDALLENPDRKFSYVEMKFLTMWWKGQTEQRKDDVRKLVKEGRLEFLNGGWSMHDEACTHYEDMINNMLIGNQFLLDEFGVKPRIAWHIDPFGHSSANVRLFADMGFEAWFFSRLDYQDRDRRLKDKEMEFIWRPFFDHFGSTKQVFTHSLYYGYRSPPDFDYDSDSTDDPFVDDPDLSTFNADVKSAQFMQWVTQVSANYATNHIMQVMGEDFKYANAKRNFKSMDRLIKYFNNRYSNVTLLYSTPSQYINALNKLDRKWPTKYDDMFPYADRNDSFWTGYFSSRANDKEFIRKGSHQTHASMKLYSVEVVNEDVDQVRVNNVLAQKDQMLDVMGISQHHDAAPGTGKQAVANNYAKRMASSIESNNQLFSKIIGEAAQALAGVNANQDWEWCFRENNTYLECPISKHSTDSKLNMVVGVYNPSALTQNIVSIAVPHANIDVKRFNQTQSKMVFENANAAVICEDETQEDGSTVKNCWLYVESEIDGHQVGLITIVYDAEANLEVQKQTQGDITIENQYESLTYGGYAQDIGAEFSLEKKEYEQEFTLSFDLRYWPSYQGTGRQVSGVYIFAPDSFTPDSLSYSKIDSVYFMKSDVIQQITLVYNDPESKQRATVKIRLYKYSRTSEWNVKTESIPLTTQGQEVTVNFRIVDLDNNSTFYTDSNALEMQKRVLNYRPTWNFSNFDSVTPNYYPINSAIAVRDAKQQTQMTVMNSRPQGGSVLKPGRIELMHNRRMYVDDRRGMGEPLNETNQYDQGIWVTSNYYLHVFNMSHEHSAQRAKQVHQDEPLQYFFNFNYNLNPKLIDPDMKRLPSGKELRDQFGFPETGKIEIFPMSRSSVILRLENIADKFDLAQNQSQKVPYLQIDEMAKTIFRLANNGEEVSQVIISETSLLGTELYSYMQSDKIQWKGVDDDFIKQPVQPSDISTYNIALEAQRIRTFYIQFLVYDEIIQ
ncbi:glycosyl hydrolases family 38 protein [Stylonychia lemnae]|uniref:Glycosyl hydrolases family 38 protein n=1 Tax=Stylonychia lemnae TaxID=5949 RepID=A0A078B6G9_STYLE|nr:glycosyl hydrolases family 38 protein [Stylonychia lemnae]|eukprot:CDW90125.1 glycosyl hydrolases family 38 protein [Stylonychia lemnae]